MKPFQRSLYDELCKEFGFKSITDIGKFLGLRDKYHGSRFIFQAQKQNIYLKALLKEQRKDNKRISELTEVLENIRSFKESVRNIDVQLNKAKASLTVLKENLR